MIIRFAYKRQILGELGGFVPSSRKGTGPYAAITVVSPFVLFQARYLGISSWTIRGGIEKKLCKNQGGLGVDMAVQTRYSAFGC